jgi:hypothetical protein
MLQEQMPLYLDFFGLSSVAADSQTHPGSAH